MIISFFCQNWIKIFIFLNSLFHKPLSVFSVNSVAEFSFLFSIYLA
jgi:hypothetical protein